MLVYNKRIRDNTPEIRPAGKVIPSGHSAKECLSTSPNNNEEEVSDIVRRMRGVSWPKPGVIKDMRGRNGDLPVDRGHIHGIKTKSSLKASHMMNPPPLTKFEQVMLDHNESLYMSKNTKPLGSSHDQASRLPREIDPAQTKFGMTTVKDSSVAEVVSPDKSTKEIDKEYYEGRHLYRKSHNDWDVGEMIDRDYNWSKFKKTSLYGVDTPHDNSGQQVNGTLHWLSSDDGKVVSKRLDEFREKTQPQIGKVHDPLVNTMGVPLDHTFGIIVPVDELSAGELIQIKSPTIFSECPSFDRGVLSTIRTHLKNHPYHDFLSLLDALCHVDKEKNGVISADKIRDIFFQFNVPLTSDMLEMLLHWCAKEGVSQEGVVYEDLIALMDWKRPLEEEILAKFYQKEQNPMSTSKCALLSNYMTSSQAHRAVAGDGEISTQYYRPHGVPTVRYDLPAPRIRRVADNTNYGDEASSYGLIYPSIYSNHGVYESDFFKPHPPEKIRSIFEKIGVVIPDDVFDELWKKAIEQDPMKQVSVESFRTVMENMLSSR